MIKVRKGQKKRVWRWWLLSLELLLLIPVLLLLVSNQVIRLSAESHLFDTIEEIPHNRAGLVLGTSPMISGGGPNPYFHNRMIAASELFHSGKVEYLIVSGDNRTPYYNEPRKMREALIRLGVPGEVIYMDFAGLRTLDSVVRSKEVFGQESITIISQRFHNQRAVYIAKRHKMDVSAFNAKDVPPDKTDKTRVREWLAKANVFLDLLTQREPRHLGAEIIIGEEE